MHSIHRKSRRIRGQSLEFDLIAQHRRRQHVSSVIPSPLGASHSDSEVPSSVRSNPYVQATSFPPPLHAMVANAWGSTLLGSTYSGYNPTVSANDPTKVVKTYGLFRFEEDANDTPWHVPSPLNLTPARQPLPKFKDYLLKFSGNGTCTVEDHLNVFSNACHNIGANNNDTCMRLFLNSLEGKVSSDFFDLPPKSFSTWVELCY